MQLFIKLAIVVSSTAMHRAVMLEVEDMVFAGDSYRMVQRAQLI
jgi:ribosomal protein S17